MTRDIDLEWLVYDNRSELLKFLPSVYVELLPDVKQRPPGGSGGCLVRGSPVHTALGAVAVEDLREGQELVVATDSGDVGSEFGRLARIACKRATSYVAVNSNLGFSDRQPVLVAGRGWVRARKLRRRDRILGPDGAISVENVAIMNQAVDLFDLRLAGPLHAYAGNEVWCHNKKK